MAEAPANSPAETAPEIPPRSGSYVVELHLNQRSTAEIGRLGWCELPPGIYLYLGSARGPGGLRARLMRHLRPPEAIHFHWHIDYLRVHMHTVAIAWMLDAGGAPADLECRWSQGLLRLPGAAVPIPGFGASDCRSGCSAHLVHFNRSRVSRGIFLRNAEAVEVLEDAAGMPGLLSTWGDATGYDAHH